MIVLDRIVQSNNNIRRSFNSTKKNHQAYKIFYKKKDININRDSRNKNK